MELIEKVDILSLSKKGLKEEAKLYVLENKDKADPMSAILKAKKAEEFFKTVQEELKADALKEAEKHPERCVEKFGAKFEKTSVYTSYDYTNCNDVIYADLLKQKQEIESKVKEREELLKTLKNPLVITDEETGETFKIYPAVKKTTDGLKITY